MSILRTHLDIVNNGEDLSAEQMQEAIVFMMSGKAKDEEVANFLIALSDKGESAEEIVGAAKALREKVSPIQSPASAVDCCGTGGDGLHTYNISTAVAFVSAACGVPMAKHGNRASSSKCGAADVLEALDVNLDMPRQALEEALGEIGFAFLMAPKHHSSMKHVAAVRKKLGRRTIFNLIGPLANPASTKKQLIGVFDKSYVHTMAKALKTLGTESAWVVHGLDGMDEITVTGKTIAASLHNNTIDDFELTPEQFGLNVYTPEELKGGDAQTNASALLGILNGEKNAYRAIVLANAAAVLKIAGEEADLNVCANIAAEALDNGQALDVLRRYQAFTMKYKGAA